MDKYFLSMLLLRSYERKLMDLKLHQECNIMCLDN